MVDRPVIFSAPMVRALLEGRKSQTRRILKPYNGPYGEGVVIMHEPWCEGMRREIARFKPPYAFGDRLWVRERFVPDPPLNDEAWDDHDMSATEWSGCGRKVGDVPAKLRKPKHCVFHSSWNGSELRWRPPIHMPRWASRLTLTVTDVRVERLQGISDADAIKEGCPGVLGPNPDFPDEWDPAPAEEFRSLWNSIHGPEAWDANPWVVAVSFATERRNIDTPAKEAT